MKIFIETLGCPKNFNDSEVAAGILEKSSHEIVKTPSEADAIMVNTCGFIGDAKKESIERIFDMVSYKKLLIVSGCLAERYNDELFEELPEADIMIGVNDYENLPQILDSYDRGKRRKQFSLYDKEKINPARKFSDNPYSATIKIAEGCNNRCTYCIIPFIRGNYRSVPKEQIIEEAERLANAGTKELILIAQDTTAYGMDFDGKYHLAELLRELCKVDGIKWIRILYAYEDRITDELIDVMAEEEKICKYIDIPIQHVSDNVLNMMERRSSKRSIKSTLEKLRKNVLGIHIRTTLIVGFPGESGEDFDELMNFVAEEKFDRLGVFAYSPEEGTKAAEMTSQLDEKTKAFRLDQVMSMQMETSLNLNKGKIGQEFDVIIDEEDEKGVYIGRTQYDAPEIDNTVLVRTRQKHNPGDFVRVKITDAFDYDLVGEEI